MSQSPHFSPLSNADSAAAYKSEAQRIREIYNSRSRIDAPLDFFVVYSWQERQLLIADFLRGLGISSLSGMKILDIGCGAGGFLRRLQDFGAEPKNCFGIDL